MDESFDGDAISRADREFLASLGEHPLRRNPLYGAPCPPRPNFGPFDRERPGSDRGAAQVLRRRRHLDAGKLRVSRRRLHEQRRRHLAGRRRDHRAGGPARAHGAVGVDPRRPARRHQDALAGRRLDARAKTGARSAGRRRAPTSRARPSWKTATPYSTATGRRRTRRAGARSRRSRNSSRISCPTRRNGKWLWHWLAHKARRPWVPMVAVIMVAEDFGSGRGTLFDILELLFGKTYVVPCAFAELTGSVGLGAF